MTTPILDNPSLPLKVMINGAAHGAFDPAREEIDLSSLGGRVAVRAEY